MAMAISVPRFTIADLERFPNDGNRYELLDGMLLVTPAPSRAHQIIVSRLQLRLGRRSSRVYDREFKRDATSASAYAKCGSSIGGTRRSRSRTDRKSTRM